MSTHPWDDIPNTGGGTYFKFRDKGDSIKGTVTAIRKGTDFDGNPAPEMDVQCPDGETFTVTCDKAQLKRQILDLRPNVGDTVAIVYTDDERTAQGGSMKCFDVAVKPGDGPLADPTPAAAAKPASAADLI